MPNMIKRNKLERTKRMKNDKNNRRLKVVTKSNAGKNQLYK